jgi:cysteine desulfurase/selenocysteine lyase
MALLEKITLMTKVGGGSASTIESNKKVNLAPIPARFEAGTPNTEGILGFGAAIDFLEQIGMKNIIQKEHELKQYFDKKIIDVKNIDYVSKEAKFPICSFNINGVNPQDLANYLGKAGIIVRGGLACAKLSYKITKNTVGYVRASFYFYNDFKDIDVLINALKKFDKKNIADAIL